MKINILLLSQIRKNKSKQIKVIKISTVLSPESLPELLEISRWEAQVNLYVGPFLLGQTYLFREGLSLGFSPAIVFQLHM